MYRLSADLKEMFRLCIYMKELLLPSHYALVIYIEGEGISPKKKMKEEEINQEFKMKQYLQATVQSLSSIQENFFFFFFTYEF